MPENYKHHKTCVYVFQIYLNMSLWSNIYNHSFNILVLTFMTEPYKAH